MNLLVVLLITICLTMSIISIYMSYKMKIKIKKCRENTTDYCRDAIKLIKIIERIKEKLKII